MPTKSEPKKPFEFNVKQKEVLDRLATRLSDLPLAHDGRPSHRARGSAVHNAETDLQRLGVPKWTAKRQCQLISGGLRGSRA